MEAHQLTVCNNPFFVISYQQDLYIFKTKSDRFRDGSINLRSMTFLVISQICFLSTCGTQFRIMRETLDFFFLLLLFISYT